MAKRKPVEQPELEAVQRYIRRLGHKSEAEHLYRRLGHRLLLAHEPDSPAAAMHARIQREVERIDAEGGRYEERLERLQAFLGELGLGRRGRSVRRQGPGAGRARRGADVSGGRPSVGLASAVPMRLLMAPSQKTRDAIAHASGSARPRA